MSEPDANAKPHDPFGLLKAILIGTALGFFAVLVAHYVLPAHQEPISYAAADLDTGAANGASLLHNISADIKTAQGGEPSGKSERGEDVGAPASEEKPSAEGAQPPVPAAPQPPKEITKSEPVLVPAVSLKYPKTFSDDSMSAALQPLLSFKISDSDAAALKDVASSVSKGDDSGARAAIKKISDRAAKTFAEWKRLRPSTADFDEVMAFRKAHPLFPEPVQDPGFEKQLFLSDASSADVLKFYTNRNPMTGAGKASLGAALMETGERERGLSLIKFAWSRYTLDPVVQERFVSRFGTLLDANDGHRRQLLIEARAKQQDDANRKVASAPEGKGLKGAARLRAKRAGRQSAHNGHHHGRRSRFARRGRGRRHGEIQTVPIEKEAELQGKARIFGVAPLTKLVTLKEEEEKVDDAANQKEEVKADKKTEEKSEKEKPGSDSGKPSPETAAKPADAAGKTGPKKTEAKDENPGKNSLQSKAAENAFKLTKESTGGPATLLARLKSLRREGADDDVWSLLRSINPDTADLADPERWWDFRRSEVRRALNEDHPATAYAIAKAHGPLDEESRSEAEFLAGWVALRYLKDPHLAAPHFEASRSKGFARDEARADYWLGRTKLALGARKEAGAHFRDAANRFYTFYGSLAKEALRKDRACEFRAPPEPSQEAIAAFVNEDAFKALMIAKQLDLQPLVNNYILDLVRQLNDPVQITLVLELAGRVAPAHVVVRAAKIALLRGFPVDAYAFPTLLPKFSAAGGNGKLELALLNALTRQESDFHTGSISRVGARGLMQLMPQTAKLVAAANNMKYETPRLVSDPSYNVTLGSAFLAQLVSGYDGSYVLALAAYNAGPGRVKQWIKDIGDPRDKSSDPIDWVERIPFTETRGYIQHILESTQLYRCRFENGKGRFQIVEDLHRGRPGKVPDFSDVTGSGELEETP